MMQDTSEVVRQLRDDLYTKRLHVFECFEAVCSNHKDSPELYDALVKLYDQFKEYIQAQILLEDSYSKIELINRIVDARLRESVEIIGSCNRQVDCSINERRNMLFSEPI